MTSGDRHRYFHTVPTFLIVVVVTIVASSTTIITAIAGGEREAIFTVARRGGLHLRYGHSSDNAVFVPNVKQTLSLGKWRHPEMGDK